jgi:hypothetical protein
VITSHALQLGDQVRHVVRRKFYDEYVGIVVSLAEQHPDTHAHSGRIGVRWIEPNGDPSSSITWCWPFELELITDHEPRA